MCIMTFVTDGPAASCTCNKTIKFCYVLMTGSLSVHWVNLLYIRSRRTHSQGRTLQSTSETLLWSTCDWCWTTPTVGNAVGSTRWFSVVIQRAHGSRKAVPKVFGATTFRRQVPLLPLLRGAAGNFLCTLCPVCTTWCRLVIFQLWK